MARRTGLAEDALRKRIHRATRVLHAGLTAPGRGVRVAGERGGPLGPRGGRPAPPAAGGSRSDEEDERA